MSADNNKTPEEEAAIVAEVMAQYRKGDIPAIIARRILWDKLGFTRGRDVSFELGLKKQR